MPNDWVKEELDKIKPTSWVDQEIEAIKADAQAPEPRSVGGFVGNLAKSHLNALGDIANLATLPVKMAGDVIGNQVPVPTVPSAGQPINYPAPTPTIPPKPFMSGPIDRFGNFVGQAVKGTADYLRDYKDPLKVLYEDPLRPAADVATLASLLAPPVGAAALGARALSLPRAARAISAVGKVARGVEKWANPITGPAAAVKALSGPAREAIARPLYASAIKPALANSFEKAQEIVDTGIKGGYQVSTGGLQAARADLGGLQKIVDAMVAEGQRRGLTIDARDVVAYLSKPSSLTGRSLLDDVGPMGEIGGSKNLEQVQNIIDTFLAEHSKPGIPPPVNLNAPYIPPTQAPIPPRVNVPIPIEPAHVIKKNTGGRLANAYGEKSSVEKEATKGLVRGMKEEIARVLENEGITSPIGEGINVVNLKEGKVIDFLDELEGVISKEFKKAPTPYVPEMWSATAGHMLFGIPGAVAGALVRHLGTSPSFGSKVALALSSQSPAKYPFLRKLVETGARSVPAAGVASDVRDRSLSSQKP